MSYMHFFSWAFFIVYVFAYCNSYLNLASNFGALHVQMLRSLKDAFWPFQHDNTRSLFLRAAHAANFIDRSNVIRERSVELCCIFYVYISLEI